MCVVQPHWWRIRMSVTTINKYAKSISLYVVKSKKDISKKGFCVGYNGKVYTNFNEYKKEAKSQFIKTVKTNFLIVESDIKKALEISGLG